MIYLLYDRQKVPDHKYEHVIFNWVLVFSLVVRQWIQSGQHTVAPPPLFESTPVFIIWMLL